MSIPAEVQLERGCRTLVPRTGGSTLLPGQSPAVLGGADVEKAVPASKPPALPLPEAGEEQSRDWGWRSKHFQSLLGMRKALTLLSRYCQTQP